MGHAASIRKKKKNGGGEKKSQNKHRKGGETGAESWTGEGNREIGEDKKKRKQKHRE